MAGMRYKTLPSFLATPLLPYSGIWTQTMLQNATNLWLCFNTLQPALYMIFWWIKVSFTEQQEYGAGGDDNSSGRTCHLTSNPCLRDASLTL